MKLVLTKRLLGIPVKIVTVELPDVAVSVTVSVAVSAGRDIQPTHPQTPTL